MGASAIDAASFARTVQPRWRSASAIASWRLVRTPKKVITSSRIRWARRARTGSSQSVDSRSMRERPSRPSTSK
ncbi:MAG: hypothetical protein QM704_13385 [Anaeromyxobacteraceae bacterium]